MLNEQEFRERTAYYEKVKTKLVIKDKGSLSIGECVTTDGRKFTVIGNKSCGYGLKEGLRWLKNNCKRISTLQKFADKNGYGIEIIEE